MAWNFAVHRDRPGAFCHRLWDGMYYVIITYEMCLRRGAAMVYRMSVCPSVPLVDCDHIHRNSRKVISHINSVILPLLGDPNIIRKFEA